MIFIGIHAGIQSRSANVARVISILVFTFAKLHAANVTKVIVIFVRAFAHNAPAILANVIAVNIVADAKLLTADLTLMICIRILVNAVNVNVTRRKDAKSHNNYQSKRQNSFHYRNFPPDLHIFTRYIIHRNEEFCNTF
jgi:hypothetical protein